MGTFDDFNFSASGSKKRFSKKRKIALACGISAAVIAVILILLLGLRTCKNQSGSSADTRKNTLELVKMYMERGQYDRALDKLDELLIQDRNDADALSLLNEVLTAKGEKTGGGSGGGNSNIKVEVDTKSLTNAVQSSIESMKSELAANNKTAEENRKAMEDLIKDRQERNAQEKALQEEAKAQQKALEEQRKKEEAARKAAEEELAKKNEKLKKPLFLFFEN